MNAGCAGAMRKYDNELQSTISSINKGDLKSAKTIIESNNSSKDKDLLYDLEKSEVERLDRKQGDIRTTLFDADAKVQIWEEEAKVSPEKLIQGLGSVILNDKTRRYDGRDYEKVFLTSRLVLAHTEAGDWDKARIEVKKMHEREALIASINEKKVTETVAESEKKGIKTTYKDLKGYPVETLDDPEVVALKNGYQNAYSHYLAAFVYESLNEPALAAAGYRQAIELRPNDSVLEEGLKGLDSRQKSATNKTDVLFVIETGFVPAIESMQIPIPLPLAGSIGLVPVSFPLIKNNNDGFVPKEIFIDGNSHTLSQLTNVNTMVRRSLRDEMPGIILRGAVRATTKAVAENAAIKNDDSGIASLLLIIGGFIVESADERIWRTLPNNFLVARLALDEGSHEVIIKNQGAEFKENIEVSGGAMIISGRLTNNNFFVNKSVPTPKKVVAFAPKTQMTEVDEVPDTKNKKSATKKKASKKKKQ